MPSTGSVLAAETPEPPRSTAGSLLGEYYFLNFVGLPGALLAATSVASLAMPSLRPLLAPFCHQIEARTVCLHGTPMGLCARCSGIYLGVAVAWLGLGWLCRRPDILRVAEPVMLLIAALSVLLHLAGVDAGNGLRLVFGLALGASAGLLSWRARRWILRRRAVAPRETC